MNPASPQRPAVKFSALWAAYPSHKPYVDAKSGEPPAGFENQCAIKVSVALDAVGVDMSSFQGARVWVGGRRAAIRADELAAWLTLHSVSGLARLPHVATGVDWQQRINGRTGIVYFSNYWRRPRETSAPSGDHIDLWNGSRLTMSGFEGAAVTFLRFAVGVNAGIGFSDLGKADKILFWEVK